MSFLLTQAVSAAEANPTPEVWRVITKMAYFAGLIGSIGGCMLLLIVLRPVWRRPSVDPADRAVLQRRAGLYLALVGTWFLIALYFQLAGKGARVKGKEIPYGQALSPAAIGRFISVPGKKGDWISSGAEALIQYSLWGLAALVLMLLFSPKMRERIGAVALASLVINFVAYQVTLLPTNWAKETGDVLANSLLDHLHVFSISTWVGGIAGLVILAFSRRKLSRGAGDTFAQIWTRFSTLAMVAVGCILITGLYLAYTLVGSPSELFTTSFGRFLVIKVSLVALMICIGAANEFVMMPRIARARAAGAEGSVFKVALKQFPALVTVEVALAIGVLFVLSFLTGSARAEAGDPADPTLSGTVVGIGVVLAILIAVSFVTTAKVSDRLSRSAVRPGEVEQREAVAAES
ncbi:copper resistance D family protein [Amycolatopsis sp. FDAARGOS 1241]|uniref:copper resistance D family protein n=1 Tax=Amycolatopsis sp. FDAARGOS 1241 TaxID=2778070 RepID=UPI00194EF68A|nr:CopD family protein [Amycolatopsis sp. FDAARGOS 1241]QRP47719.1 CopD family protein [Amycolatopsis sp. FDAARGOS 1241]